MHAGTEQLLTIRDGRPIDAGIAQHVEDCGECRDRLNDLREMRAALRELPQLKPPADGWQKLLARMEQPASRRRGWLSGAVAAAALIAVALYQFGARDSAPDQADRLATTSPESGQVLDSGGADDVELEQLVAQSRQLEQLLREINSRTPRVMNAGTAGTIAGLQDSIAYIDYGLSYEERLDRPQSEQLWRQRVGLMNTLVQVRGAQLQRVSN